MPTPHKKHALEITQAYGPIKVLSATEPEPLFWFERQTIDLVKNNFEV